MKLFFILLLFISNNIFSQALIYLEKEPNSKVNLIDDSNQKQGLWVYNDTIYPTIRIVNYKNDTLNGYCYTYWKNGMLQSCYEYKMGRLWNTIAYFDKEGNSLDCGTIKNGNGYLLDYFLDTLIIYDNKRKTIVMPHPNKQPFSLQTYHNGLAQGLKIKYFRNGAIDCTGNVTSKILFDNNYGVFWGEYTHIGEWYHYSRDGNLIAKTKYDTLYFFEEEVISNDTLFISINDEKQKILEFIINTLAETKQIDIGCDTLYISIDYSSNAPAPNNEDYYCYYEGSFNQSTKQEYMKTQNSLWLFVEHEKNPIDVAFKSKMGERKRGIISFAYDCREFILDSIVYYL